MIAFWTHRFETADVAGPRARALRSAPIRLTKCLHSVAPVFLLWCVGAIAVAAAELTPRASAAYDAYLAETRQAFFARLGSNAATVPKDERVPPARPGREDGIVLVPGGLVHHWVGAAFIPRTTLRRAIDVSSAYDAYPSIYKEVIASKLVGREGDTYSVRLRLKESVGAVGAVLEIRSTIRYSYPSDRVACALSTADEIREVKNAGQSNERLLPAGRDSGYLWRATNFTRFTAREDGVYVEMETLGLSRGFPPFLGWLIEPIARRLGRESIERSLEQFIAAGRKQQ